MQYRDINLKIWSVPDITTLKRRCGVIANETILHQKPKSTTSRNRNAFNNEQSPTE